MGEVRRWMRRCEEMGDVGDEVEGVGGACG